MTVILIIGVLSLLTWYFYIKLRRPPGFPPGPPAVPFFGSLPFFHEPAKGVSFYKELTRLGKRYGPIFSVALGHKWMVVLNDKATMKEAFVKNGIGTGGRVPSRSDNMKYLNPHFPELGIVDASYSEEWKLQKRAIVMALKYMVFNSNVSESIIGNEVEKIIKANKMPQKDNNVRQQITTAVTSTTLCILFGSSCIEDDTEPTEIKRIVADFFSRIEDVERKRYIPGIAASQFYKNNQNNVIEDFKKLRIYLENKLEKALKAQNVEEPDNFVEGYCIQREKNGNTKNRLYQIATDFVLAGIGTIHATIGWGIYYMVAHPDIQVKVQEELDRIVGRERQPETKDKHSMPYVGATLLEILRLATATPRTIYHQTLKNVKLGEYSVPKGTLLFGNLWNVLRDPDLWEDTDAFKPERFLNQDGEIQNSSNVLPFGLGMRSCIGEQLARQELFLYMTRLLHAFTIGLPDGVDLPPPVGTMSFIHLPPTFDICLTPRDKMSQENATKEE